MIDFTPIITSFLSSFFFVIFKLWPLWIVVIFIKLIKSKKKKIKGSFGEGLVNFTAAVRLNSRKYHMIKNVTIPTKRGTTQIDHIIVL